MSVRAYKCKRVAHNPSFNLWFDNPDLIGWVVDRCGFCDGCAELGFISISEDDLRILQEELKGFVPAKELNAFVRQVKKDMGKDDFVHYVCF